MTRRLASLFFLFLLSLSGCGSSGTGATTALPQIEPTPPSETASLRGKWQLADDGQTVLDFTSLNVGEERSSEEILYTCDHYTWGNRARNFTNSGNSPSTQLADLTPGAQQGIYKVMGSESTGEIQIGYLRNSQFTNDICRIMSSEHYSFVVSSDTLTLLLQAPGKPYDGAMMSATRVTE